MCLSVLTKGVYTCNQFNNPVKSICKHWTDTVAVQYLPRGKTELTEACLFLSLTFALKKDHGLPQPVPPGICDPVIAIHPKNYMYE